MIALFTYVKRYKG